MTAQTFFWHDYETFGRNPRKDRPAQFAGVRTDTDLHEVSEPVMMYCQPTPDQWPEPEACLLTGITPQRCEQQGVPEHEFAQRVWDVLAQPGTLGVGYNSMKFDDEVTRFLFWRNLQDPYAREWQNQCGRWDFLNVVRCIYAFSPDKLTWPLNAQGVVSHRLEHLVQAQGIEVGAAHDALVDVRATLALARIVKERHARLWDFCLSLKNKQVVQREIGTGRPFWHVSGMYGVQRGCLALVWPIAVHPFHKNEMIVWDLSVDPAPLLGMSAQQIRFRMFTPTAQLPQDVQRLPIKTIHINQAPVVVSALKTLTPELAQRWGMDVDLCLRHAQWWSGAGLDPALWAEVFERTEQAGTEHDVTEDLYSGFVSASDRKKLDRARAQPSQANQLRFEDPRLSDLVFQYVARSDPASLTASEQQRWKTHCLDRLGSLENHLANIEQLRLTQPSESASVLDALAAHALQLWAPGSQPTQSD